MEKENPKRGKETQWEKELRRGKGTPTGNGTHERGENPNGGKGIAWKRKLDLKQGYPKRTSEL